MLLSVIYIYISIHTTSNMGHMAIAKCTSKRRMAGQLDDMDGKGCCTFNDNRHPAPKTSPRFLGFDVDMAGRSLRIPELTAGGVYGRTWSQLSQVVESLTKTFSARCVARQKKQRPEQKALEAQQPPC